MREWVADAAGVVVNVAIYFVFGFFLVWAANGPQTPLLDPVSLRGGFISGGLRALPYLLRIRGLDPNPGGS